MAGEWRTATVQELVDDRILERPIDGNHGEIHPKASDFVEHGIPFVMASDLVGGRVDTTHCAFISEEHARSLRKGFARQGDVLISHKATMGRTAFVDQLEAPFLMLTPQVTYYRVKDQSRLSARYLKLYFDSPSFQRIFETWGHKGSTRSYLGITAQLDLPIVLPPLSEQRAIAHILGTLDDKIELNRRMNEMLEAMARALFKSWFVDFDPVRAKAEGRDPGLPQPVADLFPDSFEDSELGEIPRGWGAVAIQDAFDIVDGRTLPPERRSPHHPYDAFGANGIIGRTDEAWVDSSCIVLGKIGSCGSLHRSFGPCWVTNNAFAIRGGNSGSLEFAWWTLLGIDFAQFVGGSANPYMPLKNFGHYLVVRPSPGVLAAFETRAGQLRRRLEHVGRESTTLATLRDTLLPKLISGELRVEDPARFLGGGD